MDKDDSLEFGLASISDIMMGRALFNVELSLMRTRLERKQRQMQASRIDERIKAHKDLYDSISKSCYKPVSPRIPRTLHNDR